VVERTVVNGGRSTEEKRILYHYIPTIQAPISVALDGDITVGGVLVS
jgi:hypothetical protein